MSEYISIAEFASRVGITRQAVYKRVDRGLQQFIIVDNDGRRRISTDALELFNQEVDSKVDINMSTVDSEVDNKGYNGSQQALETLQAQLEIKDKQLFIKDEQISTLHSLLREQQELNKNNQILLGATNPALIENKQNKSTEQPGQSKKKSFWNFFKN